MVFAPLVQLLNPFHMFGRLDQFIQGSQHFPGIADDRNIDPDVFPNFRRVYIDMNNTGFRCKFTYFGSSRSSILIPMAIIRSAESTAHWHKPCRAFPAYRS